MRYLSTRVILGSVCFLLPFVAMSSSSEAGVIPWVYNAVFGPSRGPYGYSYYGPAYYSAGYGSGCCGTPVMAYRPMYGCCDPCSIPCGPCGVTVSGACGVPQCSTTGIPVPSSSSPGPAPTPSNSGAPKTYAEPDKFEKPTRASGTADPNGVAPPTPARESESGFEPRKPRPAAPAIAPDNEERETRKPSASPDGTNNTTDEKKDLKSPAATPKINDGDESGTEVKPASHTNQRIAWAAALQRRQTASQPRHGTAYVVRLPAYPKPDELRQSVSSPAIAKN
jgi:hypothetical protein